MVQKVWNGTYRRNKTHTYGNNNFMTICGEFQYETENFDIYRVSIIALSGGMQGVDPKEFCNICIFFLFSHCCVKTISDSLSVINITMYEVIVKPSL